MALNNNRILIVGSGAIGNLIAMRLSKHSNNIFLTCRTREEQNILQERGVTLIDSKSICHAFIPVVSIKEISGPVDMVIIACKSFDLKVVINQYKDILDKSKVIIFIQSCLNLKNFFPKELTDKIWIAPVMLGAIGVGTGTTIETDSGFLQVGHLSSQTINSNMFKSIRLTMSKVAPTYMIQDLDATLFFKTSINAVMFPFSVAGGGSFGRIFSSDRILDIAARCLIDCAKIALANSISMRTPFCDYSADDLLQHRNAKRLIKLIVERYPNIIPSALLDIVRGRKDELQIFQNDLIELAQSKDIKVLNLEQLTKITSKFIKNRYTYNSKTLIEFMRLLTLRNV